MRNLNTALLALMLTACAVGPDYHRPEMATGASFSEASAAEFSSDAVTGRFWTVFEDPELNALVEASLAHNLDLRIALAHLTEARALQTNARLDQLPTVTAAGGYTREQLPPALLPGATTPTTDAYYQAGFDAQWELDLFGRVRRGAEAAHANVQASEASLRDAQVSITAEVARTYFELRGAQAQLEVSRRNEQNERSTLELTRTLFDAGRGTELDTARAEAQLHSTLAVIPLLEDAELQAIHRLGVLTGQLPEALREQLTARQELAELPRITAIGDPASLLRRRPDIRRAERQLAAANAGIGIAVADYFPRVTFSGQVGYAASEVGDFGQAATRNWIVGPGISWAAFDLGRVHARVKGARAATDAALAGYEQTVLQALEETENALAVHARSRQRLDELRSAAEASRTAAHIARARYEGGLVGFLEVLDAERTELVAEDALAHGQSDAAVGLVTVYKALGGAWQDAPPPDSRPLAALNPLQR